MIPVNRIVCAGAETAAWTIGLRSQSAGNTASTFHSLLMAACFLRVRTKVAIMSRSARTSKIMLMVLDACASDSTSSHLVPAQTSEP